MQLKWGRRCIIPMAAQYEAHGQRSWILMAIQFHIYSPAVISVRFSVICITVAGTLAKALSLDFQCRIAARNAVAGASELHGKFYGEGEGPKPATDTLVSGNDTGNYKDGTYTAYGEGMSGRFPVTVTITEGKITGVEIGEHGETQGIGNQIIEQQTADIDVVSGATITSNAIKSAVKACLIEASI